MSIASLSLKDVCAYLRHKPECELLPTTFFDSVAEIADNLISILLEFDQPNYLMTRPNQCSGTQLHLKLALTFSYEDRRSISKRSDSLSANIATIVRELHSAKLHSKQQNPHLVSLMGS